MDLNQIRDKIDRIDFDILKLLDQRLELALRARKLKSQVVDAKREAEVLNYIKQHSIGLTREDFSTELFTNIMSESRRLQKQDIKLLAFQGEHGAYAEVAAREFAPQMAYIPCLKFSEVFKGVCKGFFDYGIVPVENSIGGSVTEVNELLSNENVTVVGEIKIPIHHCLLALPGANVRELKKVYSHPQALSQCSKFLRDKDIEPTPFYDTAGSAKMLSEAKWSGVGAIASELSAELYHLQILHKGIEDHGKNKTRFLIIAKEGAKVEGALSKCSVTFRAEDRAGSLYEILALFAKEKINLTRIESIPSRDYPDHFLFFLDFQGDIMSEKVVALLEKVKVMTTTFKLLGRYQAS